MKEASGELSMTAVAVVAIAAIGVLFTTLIWPSIKGSILANTKCSSAFNCVDSASGAKCTTEKCKCNYYDESGNVATDTVICPNPTFSTTAATAAK